MTDKVITSIDQVSREWLTSVLTKSGALSNGEVESFEFDEGQRSWSTSANLLVKYTEAAIGSLHERLFLKMVNTDLDDEYFGDSEVTYYTCDYVDVPEAPLLRCYDAAYSKDINRYHILLDDVSGTHIEAAQKEPTLEYGLALAEGLAILHARWWSAQRLAEAGAPIHHDSHIQRFVDIAAPGVEHIVKGFSSDLKPHWPEYMRELFAKHPQVIIRRASDLNGFTIIHGDVGAYNVLVPRHADRLLYIIDRQPFNWSLTTWLGVYDLAYAIVLDWDIETRRIYENLILKHYHNHLFENGVIDYSWEQLHHDYRLCVAMCVYIATEYCRGGVIERLIPVWLPMLQRALTACDDLECSALWNES